MKIAVLGYSGSGKSTLARELAAIYNIPVLYLDTVQFLPNWEERGKDEGRAIVLKFMQNNESWIIDGNYTFYYQQERLEQADMIIYMEFPRYACLFNAIKRYVKHRNTSRESMASGCNEKIDIEFVWWILHTGRTKSVRKHYRESVLLYKNKTVVLRSRKQTDAYIKRIRANVK